jgi:hypothetical protein
MVFYALLLSSNYVSSGNREREREREREEGRKEGRMEQIYLLSQKWIFWAAGTHTETEKRGKSSDFCLLRFSAARVVAPYSQTYVKK